jgi:aspartate/methionine/tyrosine aminotransferase
VDGATFAHRLLAEHATAVTPGAAFGDAFRGHVRLALCGPTEDVEAGVAAVADLARTLAGVC